MLMLWRADGVEGTFIEDDIEGGVLERYFVKEGETLELHFGPGLGGACLHLLK